MCLRDILLNMGAGVYWIGGGITQLWDLILGDSLNSRSLLWGVGSTIHHHGGIITLIWWRIMGSKFSQLWCMLCFLCEHLNKALATWVYSPFPCNSYMTSSLFCGMVEGGINNFQPQWMGRIIRLFTTFIGGINEKTKENLPNLVDPRLM